MPPGCPRDLETDFIDYAANRSFKFYGDSRMTRLLNQEELSHWPGNTVYYTGAREHVTHCAFMMLRIQSVLMKGGRVDEISANYEHTKHCVHVFLGLMDQLVDEGKDAGVSTAGHVHFLTC